MIFYFFQNKRVFDQNWWEIYHHDIDHIKSIRYDKDLLKLKLKWKSMIINWSRQTSVVKRPEAFKHKFGNFYTDGENIYLYYADIHNITQLYNLPRYQDIVVYNMNDDGSGLYKIWYNTFLKYDGEIDITVVDEADIN